MFRPRLLARGLVEYLEDTRLAGVLLGLRTRLWTEGLVKYLEDAWRAVVLPELRA